MCNVNFALSSQCTHIADDTASAEKWYESHHRRRLPSSCRYTHVCCLSLRILKNIKTFIPCVASFVVYFFYVSLTVESFFFFLDFFLHFFLVLNFCSAESEILLKIHLFRRHRHFEAFVWRCWTLFFARSEQRECVFDFVNSIKRNIRLCIWTVMWYHRQSCDYNIQFFCLSGRLSTGLKMSQAKSDKNTYSCLLDLNLWTKTGAKKQKSCCRQWIFRIFDPEKRAHT